MNTDQNKSRLVAYLTTKGQTHTWAELAKLFNLSSGEVARHTWRKVKEDSTALNTVLEPAVAEHITSLESTIADLLDTSIIAQKRIILEELKAHSPDYTLPVRSTNTASRMLELDIFDLHIGKLSWDKETGEDYDIDIAVKRYNKAVSEIVNSIDMTQVEKILLPIGNDMLNIDNKQGTTTMGTPQSTDSRFGKMFRTAKRLMISTIDKLSALAPVDVIIVPGNHDEQTMFTLGEVLDAWYNNNKEVNVFNSPKLRKYYKYGKNMIMFTHGDKEKHQELGMIAATEEPNMWAETLFREVHVGHLHKSKVISYTNVDEFQGFKVRILPSLSGTDAWHYSKGYMAAKAATGFLWDKEKGLVSNHYFNI